jgi:type IV secretory pathway VirB2 component (pilin)
VALRLVLAAVLAVVGVVWIGQGVGWVHGSFMTGQAVWAVIGAVLVLAAAALVRGAMRAGDDGGEQ